MKKCKKCGKSPCKCKSYRAPEPDPNRYRYDEPKSSYIAWDAGLDIAAAVFDSCSSSDSSDCSGSWSD